MFDEEVEEQDLGERADANYEAKTQMTQKALIAQEAVNSDAMAVVQQGPEAAPEQDTEQESEQGYGDDILTGVVQGAVGAISEPFQSVIDLADMVAPDYINEDWVDGGLVETFNEEVTEFLEGDGPLGFVGNFINQTGALVGDDGTLSERLNDEEGPETIPGQLAEGVTRFVPMFIGLGKFVNTFKWGSQVAKNHKLIYEFTRGAVVDAATIDPYEARLSDLAAEWELTEPIAELLGSDPEDSAMESRFKAAAEGAVLGEVGGLIARKVKSYNLFKKASQEQAISESPVPDEVWKPLNSVTAKVNMHRQAVDDLVTMQEWWRRWDEAAPGMREFNEFMDAGDLSPEALEKLGPEAKQLYETLQVDAGASGISMQEARANRLGQLAEQNELTRLKDWDERTYERVIGFMEGEGVKTDGTVSLDQLIAASKAKLVQTEKEWREAILSPEFASLPDKQKTRLLDSAAASMRSQSQGFRSIQEITDSYRELHLEVTKRSKGARTEGSPDGTPARVKDDILANHNSLREDRLTDWDRTQSNLQNLSKISRPVFGNVHMSGEDMGKLSRAVQEEDFETAAEALFGTPQAKGMDPYFARRVDDEGNVYHENRWEAAFGAGGDDDNQVFNSWFVNVAKFVHEQKHSHVSKSRVGKGIKQRKTIRQANNLLAGMEEDIEKGWSGAEAFQRTFGLDKDTVDLHSQQTAARILLAGLSQRMLYLGNKAAVDTSLHDRYALMSSANMFASVYDMYRGRATDMARAMRSMRYKIDGQVMSEKRMMDLISDTSSDPEKMIGRLKSAMQGGANPDEISNIVAENHAGYFSYWLNGLLSNPPTHVINNVTNAFMVGYQPSLDMLNAAIRGEFKEAADYGGMVFDAARAFKGSFQAAAKAYRHGVGGNSPLPGLGVTGPLGIKANQLYDPGATRQSFAHNAMRALDHGLGVPGKLLVAADAAAKHVNYVADVRRQVKQYVRESRPELKGADFNNAVDSYANQVPRWAEHSNVMDSATKYRFSQIDKSAQEYMDKQTFTNELGEGSIGKIGEATRRTRLGRWIAPFVRTPVNLAKFTSSHIPMVDMVIKEERDKLFRSGAKGKIEKTLKYTVAAGAVSWVGEGVENGLITGGGPANRHHKEGWDKYFQPYSLRVGWNDDGTPKWVRYDRLLPVGAWMGLVADFVAMSTDMHEDDVNDVGTAIMAASINQFSNMSFLRGVFDFTNAVSEPRNAGYYIANLAGTVVPFSSLTRSVRYAADPVKRVRRGDGVDGSLNFMQMVMRSVQDGLPGWSSSLEPDLNMFAEAKLKPVTANFNMVNPAWTVDAETDPAMKRIAELGPALDMTAFRKLKGADLSPAQTNEWIRIMNNNGKMKEVMSKLVLDPRFQALNPSLQREKFEEYFRMRKQRASQILIQRNPEVKLRVATRKINELERDGEITEDKAGELREHYKSKFDAYVKSGKA